MMVGNDIGDSCGVSGDDDDDDDDDDDEEEEEEEEEEKEMKERKLYTKLKVMKIVTVLDT